MGATLYRGGLMVIWMTIFEQFFKQEGNKLRQKCFKNEGNKDCTKINAKDKSLRKTLLVPQKHLKD